MKMSNNNSPLVPLVARRQMQLERARHGKEIPPKSASHHPPIIPCQQQAPLRRKRGASNTDRLSISGLVVPSVFQRLNGHEIIQCI
mmetsp:Transcript_39526/g.82093  ORF Transcript_39526/g.82093 Transcript_39526/m.82093 type:complete len:86 (-) Transcript_39526:741-998(-)